MAKNNHLQFEKLIEDSSFIHWVHGEHNTQTQEWEYRYHNNPEDREVMDQAKLLVEGIPFNRRFISDAKVESAWRKMGDALERTSAERPIRSRTIQINWRIAAAFFALLVAGLWLYTDYKNGEELYTTAYGERKEVVLSDGSLVTMNANSTLRYLRRNPRNVTMTGEIYFDIEKKPRTGEPFIVQTPDLDIHVLGTEFNVNSRQDKTAVLLDEGSIELDIKERERMRMEPGDFVSYSLMEDRIIEQKAAEKPEVITSWKEGVLLLDSISLESTLSLLEDTYNVTAVIRNEELGHKILVGGVPNDNLAVCVRSLRTIYNLDIELTADSLIVR